MQRTLPKGHDGEFPAGHQSSVSFAGHTLPFVSVFSSGYYFLGSAIFLHKQSKLTEAYGMGLYRFVICHWPLVDSQLITNGFLFHLGKLFPDSIATGC